MGKTIFTPHPNAHNPKALGYFRLDERNAIFRNRVKGKIHEVEIHGPSEEDVKKICALKKEIDHERKGP